MTEQEQTYIFSTNLKRLLEERDLSQKKVAEEIGVIPQTFNRWVQGLSIPRMDKIQKLADYFKIKKTDLIDRPNLNNEENCTTVKMLPACLSPLESLIIEKYRIADEIDQNSVLRTLKIERQDKKKLA